ncbi:hypothetical protein E4U53_004051 [Claviceps sorghi]|nr:hypothetical protein E4U53_004051 [Claviceps sorghi]
MNTTKQGVLRKVGRGGAGNVYSVNKQDESTTEKDLERQDNPARPVVAPTDAPSLRAGRGGAGNFVDAAQVPAAQEQERNTARELDEALCAANLKKKSHHDRKRMGGRGGAGNWAGGEGEDGGDDDEAGLTRTEEMERTVKEAVDRGLKVPERAHHGREKDVKP